MRKYFLQFIVCSIFLGVVIVGFKHISLVNAQATTSPVPLDGYLWSSNIGWISMSTTTAPTYAVNLEAPVTVGAVTTRALNGHAWSSNIGWIKFGGLGGPLNTPFPTGSGIVATDARINLTNGNRLEGWARACAGMRDPVNCTDTVASATSGLTLTTGPVSFNLQTSIFEQQVYVKNNTATALPGVRITLESPLPSGTTLKFANTDSNSKFYLQHNYPIAPGQTVHIVAEYWAPALNMPMIPLNFSAQALNQALSEPVLPVGSTLINTIPSSSTLYPNNNWTTLPYKIIFWSQASLPSGEKAAIQYSDDNGVTWRTYFGQGMSIHVADGPGVNVVDYGAPHTMVPPPANRMYKVYKLPTGTYPARDGGSTSEGSQGAANIWSWGTSGVYNEVSGFLWSLSVGNIVLISEGYIYGDYVDSAILVAEDIARLINQGKANSGLVAYAPGTSVHGFIASTDGRKIILKTRDNTSVHNNKTVTWSTGGVSTDGVILNGVVSPSYPTVFPVMNGGALPTTIIPTSTIDPRGGWDGWISLSGTTPVYGVTGATTGTGATAVTNFSGFSWGSDVVGWVDWSKVSIPGVVLPGPEIKLSTNSNLTIPTVSLSIVKGGRATLYWNTLNIPIGASLSATYSLDGTDYVDAGSIWPVNKTASGSIQNTLTSALNKSGTYVFRLSYSPNVDTTIFSSPISVIVTEPVVQNFNLSAGTLSMKKYQNQKSNIVNIEVSPLDNFASTVTFSNPIIRSVVVGGTAPICGTNIQCKLEKSTAESPFTSPFFQAKFQLTASNTLVKGNYIVNLTATGLNITTGSNIVKNIDIPLTVTGDTGGFEEF